MERRISTVLAFQRNKFTGIPQAGVPRVLVWFDRPGEDAAWRRGEARRAASASGPAATLRATASCDRPRSPRLLLRPLWRGRGALVWLPRSAGYTAVGVGGPLMSQPQGRGRGGLQATGSPSSPCPLPAAETTAARLSRYSPMSANVLESCSWCRVLWCPYTVAWLFLASSPLFQPPAPLGSALGECAL